MNRIELKAKLESEGVNPTSYSIDGRLPPYEGLILEYSGGMWRIEHFERGMRRELESFVSEHQACDTMYALIHRHFM
jgi:hypothetical protein